jgi:hypothetical protein
LIIPNLFLSVIWVEVIDGRLDSSKTLLYTSSLKRIFPHGRISSDSLVIEYRSRVRQLAFATSQWTIFSLVRSTLKPLALMQTGHNNSGCCTTKKWAIWLKTIFEIPLNLRVCGDENLKE